MIDNGSPFAGAKRRIIHCAHHRAGTAWFTLILRDIAKEYGLRFAQRERFSPVALEADITVDSHSSINLRELSNYVGSHVVRDPRDMVVSAYFYHLMCREEWVYEPREEFSGRNYQEELNRLPQEEGLLLEMERMNASDFEEMRCWDYHNPNIVELKFENTVSAERETFEKLFKSYGFTPEAVKTCGEIVLRHNKGAALRRIERIQALAAVRSPTPTHFRPHETKDWRSVFTKAHTARAKDLVGDLLIQTGYENSVNW